MTKQNITELEINGTTYVPKNSVADQKAESFEGLEYVLVRTHSAGVHIGYLKQREGREVTLIHSRRVWYWSGAMSLSQLAMEGSKKQNECKISMPVREILLMEAIEIISVALAAQKNIDHIPEWKQ